MSRSAMPTSVAKRLGYALKRAQHALRMNMDEALRPVGLTMPQYAVMCALEAEPGMSNARLARASFVTAQTMQGIIANLERTGTVVRTRDPGNARILFGTLSAEGKELLTRAHHAVSFVETRLATAVGSDKAEDFAEALFRCADHLEGDR